MRDYTLLEELGSGLFGVVYLTKKSDGHTCALKIPDGKCPDKQKYNKGDLDELRAELIHDNIVQIQEVFKHEEHIYIAMQLCDGGDLNDYFVQNKPEMQERLDFMVDMAKGLHFLHSHGIIHCNLKSENVLLKHNGTRFVCKISDFGISQIKFTRQQMSNIYRGHPAYLAPEINDGCHYSKPSDIYALGLLFFAVVKCNILKNSNEQEILVPGVIASNGSISFLNAILKKNKPNKGSFLSTYVRDEASGTLIYTMLSYKPENRPSVETILIKIHDKNHYEYTQSAIQLLTERAELQGVVEAYRCENRTLKEQITLKDNKITSLEEKLSSSNARIRSLEDEIRIKEASVSTNRHSSTSVSDNPQEGQSEVYT